MTIESDGKAFTFTGKLVGTEVTMESPDRLDYFGDSSVYLPPRISVSLDIVATDVVQSVL